MLSSATPVLRIWVNPAIEGLRELYRNHIESHNKHITEDPHPNSGFDLFVPGDVRFHQTNYVCSAGTKQSDPQTNKARLVNHGIKAAMYDPARYGENSCPFYLYPRSSIYKTPLMLANSTGIIDSGYRGWICSALRFLPTEDHRVDDKQFQYDLEANARLTQICHPSLMPFLVEMVDDEEVLESTTRGSGGFGSTGV